MATALVPAVQSRYDQPEIVSAIRQTVAKGASDAQLRMFLEVCKNTGLDPFLKEIYFVAEKNIIMAARDGYLRVANESPQFDGMETRVERNAQNVPVKATCTVWRKDRNHPIVCEAYYSEYAKSSSVWKQYPSAMISKVAEVLALKRSFSINGVVTEEEIGDGRGSVQAAQEVAQAKIAEMRKPAPIVAIAEAAPEAEDGDDSPYELIDNEEGPSELEKQLRASIELVARKKAAHRVPGRDLMLESFADLKARYQAIGYEHTYYAYLGRWGVKHSADFDGEEGLADARSAYKEMSLDVQARETRAAR